MAFSNIAKKETEQKCLSQFCDFFYRKVYDRHLNDPKNRGGQT